MSKRMSILWLAIAGVFMATAVGQQVVVPVQSGRYVQRTYVVPQRTVRTVNSCRSRSERNIRAATEFDAVLRDKAKRHGAAVYRSVLEQQVARHLLLCQLWPTVVLFEHEVSVRNRMAQFHGTY